MKIEVTHQDMYEKGYREGYGKAMYEMEQKGMLREWIPCSERLPEENGWYIGSKVTPKGNHMTNSFWYEDGTFFTLGEVEAWMPLPEPYKKEEVSE